MPAGPDTHSGRSDQTGGPDRETPPGGKPRSVGPNPDGLE